MLAKAEALRIKRQEEAIERKKARDSGIQADRGRDFAGYMDIVLSELAKEGARSVELSFSELGTENKVEIGKVSLVCQIGSALMGLLFSKRGIEVSEMPNGDCQTMFRLSW